MLRRSRSGRGPLSPPSLEGEEEDLGGGGKGGTGPGQPGAAELVDAPMGPFMTEPGRAASFLGTERGRPEDSFCTWERVSGASLLGDTGIGIGIGIGMGMGIGRGHGNSTVTGGSRDPPRVFGGPGGGGGTAVGGAGVCGAGACGADSNGWRIGGGRRSSGRCSNKWGSRGVRGRSGGSMCGSNSGAPPTIGNNPPSPPPKPPKGSPGEPSPLPSPPTSTAGADSRSPAGPGSCCCASSCLTRIVGILTGSSCRSVSGWAVRVTCMEERMFRGRPVSLPPSRRSRSLGRP
ncbi:hypothetical protein E2C01_049052 [Portunus trituberculatus]|uniref:Uncharacterized protein n=1 Tax=Portunus trituberculatus TaxID=210409 RepID=A0A5B7G574_PORTR|nr:hypothetical protein [Portunus trituberculatus]